MNKIIIRTKVVFGISSKIILSTDKDYSLIEIEKKFGKEFVLQEIFEENELSYKELCNQYYEFKRTGKSSLFAWMYKLNSKFGVVIDEHIYLYRYNNDNIEQQKLLFDWVYAENKRYMGDTWWSDDIEVLDDINNLSIIEFLEKYKGY